MSHNLMHVASIYPAYPIYISYTSDLYVLRVPSIDALNSYLLSFLHRIASALFSAASITSRSPGPLSLIPQRCRIPWIITRCNSVS